MSTANKLGLNDNEFGTYLLMLKLGPLTEGEIAGLMKISYEDAKTVTSKLRERKLAFVQKGVINKTGAVPPTEELQGTLETFATDLRKMVETVTEQIAEGQSQLHKSAEAIHKTKDSSILAIDKSLESFGDQSKTLIDESLAKGKEASDSFIQDSRAKLSQTLDGTSQELTHNLTETQKALNEELEKNKTMITTVSEDQLKQMQEKLQSDRDLVQSGFAGARESVSLALGEEKTAIESNLKSLEESVGMVLEGWSLQIEQSVTTHKENANRVYSKVGTEFDNSLEESSSIFDRAVASTEEGFKEIVATNKDSIKSTISLNRDSVLEALARTETALDEELASQKTTVANTQTEALNSMNTVIETSSSEARRDLETIRTQMSSELGRYDTSAQNLLRDKQQSIEKSCEETNSGIAEIGTGLEAGLKSKTEEFSEELLEKLTSATEETSSTFQSSISATVTSLHNLEQALSEEMNSWRSKIWESSRKLANDSLDTFNQAAKEISTQATGIIQQFQSSVNQIIKDIINNHSNTTLTLKKQIDDTFHSTNQIVENLSSKVLEDSEDALTVLTTVGTELEALSSRVQTIASQPREDLTNDFESMLVQVSQELDKVAEATSVKVNEARQKLGEALGNLKEEQKSAMDKMRTELESVTTEGLEEARRSATSLRETLQQTIATSLGEVNQKTSQTLGLIAARLDDQLDKFATQRDEVDQSVSIALEKLQEQSSSITEEAQGATKQKIDQAIQSTKEMLKTGAENAVADISGLVGRLQGKEQLLTDQIKQSILTTSQEVQESVKQNHTVMGSTIDQSFESVDTIIDTHIISPLKEITEKKALTEAQDIASLLGSLTKEIGKLDPTKEPTTQLIFSREAIIDTIVHFLKTAKRRVTIFAPTPDDLPIEALKGVPSSRQVQIICDAGDNPDWHKTLGDSGNIQVYHLTPTAHLQPIFAVDREAEEILVAPAEQEFPVGIISKEEPMIKVLTQLLTQARGMATQQTR